jgi:hypothetical protein
MGESSGSNLFGIGGSLAIENSFQSATFSNPTVQQVGLKIEQVMDPTKNATTTYSGNMLFKANASSLERSQIYEPFEATVDFSSHVHTEGTSLQPTRYSKPEFRDAVNALQGTAQTLGYVSQGVQLVRNMQLLASGNPYALAFQILGQLTNVDLTDTDTNMLYHLMFEQGPFIDYGRTDLKRRIMLSGVVNFLRMHNPTGAISDIILRAPLEMSTSALRQVTDTTSFSLTSFGHSESDYKQDERIVRTLPSLLQITGNQAQLTVDNANLDGTVFHRSKDRGSASIPETLDHDEACINARAPLAAPG